MNDSYSTIPAEENNSLLNLNTKHEGADNRSTVRLVSRDEMNLAEFPLTVLSTRASTNVKTLEFSDILKGKNGEVINRHWIITGADKFGLPTSSDDEVLLGLLKLTVDDGFRNRKVYFTRYELLRILRWTTEGRSYNRLQKALDRLSGVRIKATNAFFDNESKSHSTRNFGLLDAYEINDGRNLAPKPSFFIWSEVLFKSFQVGFIKKFDLEFYLALESAVSKRIYRYLDKHFWYRSRIAINLFTLAHEKIGISRNYQYASSLKQQIDPALDELIERGFIAKYEHLGTGKNSEIAMYAATGKPRALATKVEQEVQVNNKQQEVIELDPLLVQQQESAAHPDQVSGLIEKLVVRGLKLAQVERLLSRQSKDTISRIEAIVKYYDGLLATKSKLISKSPVGFLYRAIERPNEFSLPSDKKCANLEASRVVKNTMTQQKIHFASETTNRAEVDDLDHRVAENNRVANYRGGAGVSGSRSANSVSSPSSNYLESNYLIFRKLKLKKIKEEIEIHLYRKINQEVEHALRKLKGMISDERFKEAVEHGVDNKLAKLFAIPSFEEWILQQ